MAAVEHSVKNRNMHLPYMQLYRERKSNFNRHGSEVKYMNHETQPIHKIT